MQLLPVLERGEKVLAAVSGGADSVCLLRLLCGLRDRGDIVLAAAHLNHGIRGADADADQAFVEALCARLQVPLHCGFVDVPTLSKRNRLGLETQARLSRRMFLLTAMQRAGAGVIATAHHAQDQAETVLMHLLRGGGLRGAGGIRAREGAFCRPLLGATKADILAYLDEIGQPFCQDVTNLEASTPRNALRLEVLPKLRALYPGGEAALGRFALIAGEADDCLKRQAEQYLCADAWVTPFGAKLRVAGVHPAVLRRALMLWAELEDYDRAQALLGLCHREKGAVEWGSTRFERAGRYLYLIDTRLTPPGEVRSLADGAALTGLGRMKLTPWRSGPVRGSPLVQAVDAAPFRGAVLRTRRPGDRIHPLGAPGRRKLSDVLTDKRVDRPLRDYLPLVARDDTVLWAVGVCLSQEAAITDDTADKLRLEWKREEDTPWTTHR